MVGGAEGLPPLLEKVGAAHGDGVALEEPRAVCVPGRTCRALPFLSLALRGAELSDKDRIIGTEVLCVEIRLHACRRRGGPVAAGDALHGGPADVL